MKKKRIAAFLAALLMAIPFAALTACKKEETPPAPLLPDGIGVTVDGVYECDVFDAWDTKVPIVNKDGKRISVASGYMNREGFGASVAVKNYSEERIAHAEGAYFGGEFRFYREQVTRVPIVSKQFPQIGGSYQTIDEEWLQERIETFVEMHREATGQHPA